MTYHYSDIDPSDAIYNAAREYPGGIPALAVRLGMPVETLKKKLSPAVASHVLTYREAQGVIELLDEVVPAQADLAIGALLWSWGRVPLRVPCGEGIDSDQIFAQVMKVFGDEGTLADDIRSILAGHKKVNVRDVQKVEKDVQRVMEDLATLMNEVREKAKRDMAKR